MKSLRKVRADEIRVGYCVGYWDPFSGTMGFHKEEVVEVETSGDWVRLRTKNNDIIRQAGEMVLVIGDQGERLLR